MDLYSDNYYAKLLGRTRDWSTGWRVIDSDTVYVPILKNAHTWMLDRVRNYPLTKETVYKNYVVLLRDPIERWVTGMATYIYRINRAHDIKSRLITDAHTVPQSFYIKDISVDRIAPILVNENMSKNLAAFLDTGIDISPVNVSSLKQLDSIRNILAQDNAVLEELKYLYKNDYELLDSVSNKMLV